MKLVSVRIQSICQLDPQDVPVAKLLSLLNVAINVMSVIDDIQIYRMLNPIGFFEGPPNQCNKLE